MGSFNTACIMTGLPIIPDDEVKLFFLLKNSHRITNGCYEYDFWNPITASVDGVYADYNEYTFTNKEDPTYKLLMDYLRQNAVAMEQGESGYHDIAVDPDSIDDQNICRILHEERLFVKTYNSEQTPVALVAMHKCVWDNIMKMEMVNWDNSVFSFDTIKSELHERLKLSKALLSDLEQSLIKDEKDPHTIALLKKKAKRIQFSLDMSNLFKMQSVISLYSLRDFDIGDNDSMEWLINSYSGMEMLSRVLCGNNRNWHPIQTAGQDINHEQTIKFHEMLIDSIKFKKKEYDDDIEW